VTEYEWSVDKSFIGEGPVEIPEGETVLMEYLVNVDRTLVGEHTVIDGTYYVQVTNTGCEATSDLRIVTTIQGLDEIGVWRSIAEIEVAHSTVLQPGETATYEAAVNVNGTYLEYRAVTDSTIDNFVGHIGQRYGVTSFDGLDTLERGSAVIDGSGTLHEKMAVPEGYVYAEVDPVGPVHVNGSGQHVFAFNVTNVNSTEARANVTNEAWLELDSGSIASDSVTVEAYDPEPEPGPVQVRVETYRDDVSIYRTPISNWTLVKTLDGEEPVTILRGDTARLSFTIVAEGSYYSTGLMIFNYGGFYIFNDGDEELTGLDTQFSLQGLASDGTWIDIPCDGYALPSADTIAPGDSTYVDVFMTTTGIGTPIAMANVTDVRIVYEISWDGGQMAGVVPDGDISYQNRLIYDDPFGWLIDGQYHLYSWEFGNSQTGLAIVRIGEGEWVVNGSIEAHVELEITNVGAYGNVLVWNYVFVSQFFENVDGYSNDEKYSFRIYAGPPPDDPAGAIE